ncbi:MULTISPECIES: hypothetical protein [unclassified Alteromonas]|uniref:hypothetical protein n=1 Tax=unclassified Alteromonas TaxID=2614992 RepID=UPI0019244A70|nr:MULTISPECIES: hypothetical protein [unclassified Alteromonas]WDT84809.1 hypothetical protein OZ660_12765 [Alteromonas sp. 009811495]BCO19710.1 hypothetical protein KUC3_25670 [Alteromonas sp. KC3]BCO23676.1 hypothetical protein KUC14_25450 [Alteromonas sp. KC14]
MKGLLLIGLSALTFSVLATESEKAPAELIAELKQYCAEVAEDEGTQGKPIKAFILECVNDELESEGYAKLTSID